MRLFRVVLQYLVLEVVKDAVQVDNDLVVIEDRMNDQVRVFPADQPDKDLFQDSYNFV